MPHAAPGHLLEHRITPAAAQAALAELLVLPAAALDQRIAAELAGNPALASSPPPSCPRCGTARDGLHQAYGCARPAGSPGAGSGAEPAAPVDAAADAALAGLTGADRLVGATILADLDERGLLGRDPAAAARWLGVPEEQIHRVLAGVRTATRPDLAAADLREALLLQLAAADLPVPARERLYTVVSAHLADVAAGRLEPIAAVLGGAAAARDTVALLTTVLRPPVGLDRPEPVGPPVLPDVVVRWSPAGTPEVLLPHAGPGLHVDPGYARLAGTGRGLSAAELATVRGQLAQARDFLARLHRRAGALRQIATVAVAEQCGYLRGGALAHRPLTRTAVAQLAGVHPSTVSRAAAGKTVLLPDRRLVGFATFFGTATSVRERVAELVAAEARPLSDGQLADALREYGHRVARRTVAKYRAQLAIPAAGRR